MCMYALLLEKEPNYVNIRQCAAFPPSSSERHDSLEADERKMKPSAVCWASYPYMIRPPMLAA